MKQNSFFTDDSAPVAPANLYAKSKPTATKTIPSDLHTTPQPAPGKPGSNHKPQPAPDKPNPPDLNTKPRPAADKPKPVEGWVKEASGPASRIEARKDLSFRFRATQTPPSLLGMVVFGTAPRVMSSVDGKKNTVSAATTADTAANNSDQIDSVTPVKKPKESGDKDLSDLIDQCVLPTPVRSMCAMSAICSCIPYS